MLRTNQLDEKKFQKDSPLNTNMEFYNDFFESYKKALDNIKNIMQHTVDEKNKSINKLINKSPTGEQKIVIDVTKDLSHLLNKTENENEFFLQSFVVGEKYEITFPYFPPVTACCNFAQRSYPISMPFPLEEFKKDIFSKKQDVALRELILLNQLNILSLKLNYSINQTSPGGEIGQFIVKADFINNDSKPKNLFQIYYKILGNSIGSARTSDPFSDIRTGGPPVQGLDSDFAANISRIVFCFVKGVQLEGLNLTNIIRAYLKKIKFSHLELASDIDISRKFIHGKLSEYILNRRKEIIKEFYQAEFQKSYEKLNEKLQLLKNYSYSLFDFVPQGIEEIFKRIPDSIAIENIFQTYLQTATIETPWPMLILDKDLGLIKQEILTILEENAMLHKVLVEKNAMESKIQKLEDDQRTQKEFYENQIKSLHEQVDDLNSKISKIKTSDQFFEEKLISAAKKGNTPIIEMALTMGANVNAIDSEGETAIFHSLLNGHTAETRALLKKGADLEIRNNQRKTILHKACDQNDLGIVESILDDFPTIDAEAKTLFSILEEKRTPEIQKLIANKILFQAAKQGNVELAKKALMKGANINAQEDYYLETALHKACSVNEYKMVEFLLEKGIDTSLTNRHVQTPFQVSNSTSKAIITDFPIKNAAAVLIQSHLRGFFTRKKMEAELRRDGKTVLVEWVSKGKYQNIKEFTNSLENKKWIHAKKMIHAIPETKTEEEKSSLQIKYISK